VVLYVPDLPTFQKLVNLQIASYKDYLGGYKAADIMADLEKMGPIKKRVPIEIWEGEYQRLVNLYYDSSKAYK
jgi:hypothetical protein